MAAPAYVQASTEVSVSGTSGNASLTTSAGNLLVCALSQTDNSIRTYTVSDDIDAGNWSQAAYSNPARAAGLWYRMNCGGGATTITATASSAVAFRFRIVEVSGAETTAALDQSSSFTDAGSVGTHYCSADSTVIDTAADVFVVTSSALNASGGTNTANANYTNLASASAQVFWQYRASDAGLTDERAEWTSSTARLGVSVISSFVAPAAAGGQPTTKRWGGVPFMRLGGTTFGQGWVH